MGWRVYRNFNLHGEIELTMPTVSEVQRISTQGLGTKCCNPYLLHHIHFLMREATH